MHRLCRQGTEAEAKIKNGTAKRKPLERAKDQDQEWNSEEKAFGES